MKCLEREQLFAFAHEMLETRQAAEVRAHLEACPACRQVVTEYLRLDSALGEWKPVEPSAGFDARVRQAVKVQSKARDSSLWGGLFALTWARWLAPASLAVLVGAVALGLYRSHRIWGPAAPESPAQRLSPAAPHAPPPSAETPQEAVVEKKSVPVLGALPAKQKAGSLMANQEAPAQSARRRAQSPTALTGAGVQSSPGAGRGEAPPRPYGVGSGPTPPGEMQRDAMARATGVPEATAQPSTSATGGALAWRHAEGTNQPQRVLQAAPSASVSAEAQPQATPALPTPAGAAEAQVPTAMGSLGHQLVATPMKAPSAAKSLRVEKAQATVQGEDEEETSLHQNLHLLEDFAMLSDFDVLSELPQAGKKADDHLLELPPEEQERALANDQRFQRLRPERQDRIRENLRRWNALSPEQKDLIRRRQELFAGLSPAQRRQARAVFPEWRRLEPARQVAVLAAFHQLRSLPPDEREKYLSGPEVQQQFSPEERRVLEGLSRLLPGSQLGSGSEPEEPQQ